MRETRLASEPAKWGLADYGQRDETAGYFFGAAGKSVGGTCESFFRLVLEDFFETWPRNLRKNGARRTGMNQERCFR